MLQNRPVILLVRPQMGENIGAAARAMLNFGLTELRLVAPRDGWPSKPAEDMAAGALEKITVDVFPDFASATADIHYLFALTARRRELEKPSMTPHDAAQESALRLNAGQKAAFVFGSERAGLDNDEIAPCHAVVHIPVNPDFWSLNIAQSVLLMCYEFGKHAGLTIPAGSLTEPAPQEKFEELFTRLTKELESGMFFQTENLKPTMLRNIRTMLTRGQWTDQEIRTFQGIISALVGKKEAEKKKSR